ncbi:hypothetical protein K474DRAFT_1708068 [Panus rudis PR-1116 ss-1]|nr:hypothetical protein K474DRAFT_1708068 [Panus rudis PR-1116 ss-1]
MNDNDDLFSSSLDQPWKVASITQQSAYANLAALIVLLYDIGLTVDREYLYMWSSRQSYIGLLYYIARYFCPVVILFNFSVYTQTNPSHPICNAVLWVSNLGQLITTITIEMIMTLRVYALYDQDSRVLAGLVVMVAAEIGLGIWSCVMDVSHSFVLDSPLSPFQKGCAFVSLADRALLIGRIGSLFAAAVFFTLTVYKFLALRRCREYSLTRAFSHSTPVLVAFVEGETIYFALTFCVVLTATLLQSIGRLQPYLGGIIPSWLNVAHSIVGTRLILDLRTAAQPKDYASFSLGEVSTAEFGFQHEDSLITG